MTKRRQSVTISPNLKGSRVKRLFRRDISEDILIRENPRTITHNHSYGGLSKFFKGLAEGILFGTFCDNCNDTGVWLPPRVHCPDCWSEMRWLEIITSHAKVYTYSMTNFPGAGFKATTPCPLISIEIPGVCTKFMSYLSKFGEDEPYIGMPVRPVFRTKNPTYTILDISWVPKN